MATYTLTHLGGVTDHRASMATLIAGASAGDTVVIPSNATGYSFTTTADPGDGTPYYAIALKSGTAGSPITYTINGDLICSAGSFVGVKAAFIGIDSKSYITINGSGSVNGAAMPQTGEHRHCINIRGSDNITIDGVGGLTLKNSGGDGLYVGPTELDLDGLYTPCSNITVDDLVMIGNRRQGCSITSCNVLRMRRCQFLRSVGTSPYSGIDFEPDENTTGYTAPNQHKAVLIDCLVDECIGYGNTGGDFFVQLAEMSSSHADVSITFRNCKSVYDATGGDPWGFAIKYTGGLSFDSSSVGGTVRCERCSVSNLIYPALRLEWNLPSAASVLFAGCEFDRCAKTFDKPIDMALVGASTGGGITFDNCVVNDHLVRKATAVTTTVDPVTNVKGMILVRNSAGLSSTDQAQTKLPRLNIFQAGRPRFTNKRKARDSANRGAF